MTGHFLIMDLQKLPAFSEKKRCEKQKTAEKNVERNAAAEFLRPVSGKYSE